MAVFEARIIHEHQPRVTQASTIAHRHAVSFLWRVRGARSRPYGLPRQLLQASMTSMADDVEVNVEQGDDVRFAVTEHSCILQQQDSVNCSRQHSVCEQRQDEQTLWRKEYRPEADSHQCHLWCKLYKYFATTGTDIEQVETRIDSIDVKLAKLNAELQTYQTKMAKMRDGPGKNAIKQRALKVLQQRKMYESQKDGLMQQSFNMEQAGMMQDNLKNVMTTVDAMKTTNKELKRQYGKIDIDKIEQIQDEMADLMELGNEISESMGRAYDVPDDVNEAELDAELEALGEEMAFEQQAESVGGMPSFLQDEVPQFVDEPLASKKVAEPATGPG